MDFKVSGHGTIYMVEPVSRAAKKWVKENVTIEGWQWLGPRFSVDHRSYPLLARGMSSAGFNVTEV